MSVSRLIVARYGLFAGSGSTDVKARLVAKGFEESDKPISDSPTALRESFKLFTSVAAQEETEVFIT